jgi:hypothetical protein
VSPKITDVSFIICQTFLTFLAQKQTFKYSNSTITLIIASRDGFVDNLCLSLNLYQFRVNMTINVNYYHLNLIWILKPSIRIM